jgi:hypothetical protein
MIRHQHQETLLMAGYSLHTKGAEKKVDNSKQQNKQDKYYTVLEHD